jgi:hypothetical protein
MLADLDVERTLERLYDAGIHVTLEEFKGLRPILRPGLEVATKAEDFDNPVSARQYEARTGGSTGAPRRILVGLDLLEHESAYHAAFYDAAHARGVAAMWLPAPPGAVGIKNALIRAKLGRPIARWFSQNRPSAAPMKHLAFARATSAAAGLWGARIPAPEYLPASDALRLARFLAEHRPAVLLTTPSAAVRVCRTAREHGLDIGGSYFVVVGEPYTKAKDDIIAAAGCSAGAHYAMVEVGMIGLACHRPTAPDDVHLVSDKLATIQRSRRVDGHGHTVAALVHTTLVPASPKLMLNVESGDYGVIEERDCGCVTLPRAFRRHLHTIRSYEKLTSEGMHFLGPDLLTLVEQVLPNRFGGGPNAYQLVEREVGGMAKVQLVVSPAVGPLDHDTVVDSTLRFLRERGVGQQLMAEVWANGATLEVVRAEPHETHAGKVQALRKVER